MKPHSMFFDESYSEHYYRKETVDAFREHMDCLIVVGTALQTSFALRICAEHVDKELPLIEVNMEPAVTVGNTY